MLAETIFYLLVVTMHTPDIYESALLLAVYGSQGECEVVAEVFSSNTEKDISTLCISTKLEDLPPLLIKKEL